MILLPLIYLGLVGLAILGEAAYAIHFSDSMTFIALGPILGSTLVFLTYYGPLLIGGTIIFFMIKPFFAPRRREEKAFSLNYADAPQLFALVGWICRSLEAPIPSRIDVDCKVNASAGFRSGWRSLFGNDIILVIGLPLVAGMDLAQFAGILAHEYGHFSQGVAMRGSYFIQKINAWFVRLVYERDAWDAAIERASEEQDQNGLVVMILYLARFFIWLTRRVLWLLMAAAQALSGFMSRQMELDADRYLTRLCGSEFFPETLRRSRQLGLGSEIAVRKIREKWAKERKLFDRIPEHIVNCANEIPAETQDKMHAAHSQQRKQFFDSHPSDAERNAHARATREPGIFHSTLPATCLFADFPELSRRITLNYYEGVFGRKIPDDQLVSTTQLAAQAEHDYATDQARIERYFLGITTRLRPLIIDEKKTLVVRSPEQFCEELKQCRAKMDETHATAEPALSEFLLGDANLLQTERAAALLQAGFQFDPADFGMAENDIETAQATARKSMESAGSTLKEFEDTAKARLLNAMQLLRLPQFSVKIPDATHLQAEAKEMLFVLSRLADVFGPLLELRGLSAALEAVLLYKRQQNSADNLTAILENLSTAIQDRVNLIQDRTAQLRYPFHHANEQVMVSEYARNKDYHSGRHELALREAESHVEKLLNLHVRVLAKLIVIAEEVEAKVVPQPPTQGGGFFYPKG